MKPQRRVAAFVICLALLGTAEKCNDNRIHEAAKASDRMATLIGSAIDLKRELGQAGAITKEEELALTNHLLTLNTQVKAFNNYARTLTTDDAATRLNLAEAFNKVTMAVNALSNQAVFPIKDPEAKKRLMMILNSINSSIIIIDAALKG
jgi:hypothetical protein